MPSVRSYQNEIAGRLAAKDVPDSALEARLLLCSLYNTDTAGLILKYGDPVPEAILERCNSLVTRREAGEPLQYLLGRWEFMGLPFIVRPCALIPRADTETLAEHAISLIRGNKYRTVLDMCCGTGCIGISLAKLTDVSVTAADIDEKCVALALENAALNEVAIDYHVSDMFRSIGQIFDMIVCNPPYIPQVDLASLQREVKYEPRKALAGGMDGLDFYRLLQKEAPKHIRKGGALLMESGAGQADDIKRMFGGGYTVKDINGIERVIVLKY